MAGYYAALVIAVVLGRWLAVNPSIGTFAILLALVAPFIVGRLSVVEYGSLKLQLRELKLDFSETRAQVTQDVTQVRQEVSERLAKIEDQARDYLNTRALQLADTKIAELRKTIQLSESETRSGLDSLSPDRRVPPYLQLQKQPDRDYLPLLSRSYWLEQYYASQTEDTRPLWQLLVATERCILVADGQVPSELIMNMKHTLEFLRSSAQLDRGGQCKNRLTRILRGLGQPAKVTDG